GKVALRQLKRRQIPESARYDAGNRRLLPPQDCLQNANCIVQGQGSDALTDKGIQNPEALPHTYASPHRPLQIQAAARRMFSLPALNHFLEIIVRHSIMGLAM